jgi:CDGSH-type Zn-finger protein
MNQPDNLQKFPIIQKVEPAEYWWCACGRAKTQPFCDGSHKGTGLSPKRVQITEFKSVAWCACKHSKNPPFCDGTHSTL